MKTRSVLWTLLIALPMAWSGAWAAEDEESAGNNLSFPVIWSDGVALGLRGVFDAPVFYVGECGPDLPCIVIDDVTYWLQQEEANAWQAQSMSPIATSEAPSAVDEIDWGDNLEARDWTTNSVVRVETVLYQNARMPSTMLGFQMAHLWGEGVTEMWGSDQVVYDSAEATVYSNCARLTIQKLADEPGEPTWNAETGAWEGDGVEAPDFTGGVWEAGDGPGYYSAEINIPGKVIYGYNWRVKQLHPSDTAGTYRLTFSLADVDACGPYGLTTVFDAVTAIRMPVEEEEETEEADDDDGGTGGDTGGGTAVVDPANNLTCIDVRIVAATGSDGGGGKGGGKGRGPSLTR